MTHITSVKSNALAYTLQLFKAQATPASQAKPLAPIIRASPDAAGASIAKLAAMLIDFKTDAASGRAASRAAQPDSSAAVSGGSQYPQLPKSPGDHIRPLTAAERVIEKQNWATFIANQEQDVTDNFTQYVTDGMQQNDLYKNDPSFQAALKNGTVSIQHGEGLGLREEGYKVTQLFNSDGYYAGSEGAEVHTVGWQNLVETGADGRLLSKIDGKNAAIGSVFGSSFFVTW